MTESVLVSDEYKCRTAILLIAFNRPEQTAQVISKLRQVKPSQIYFAVDGPRKGNAGDVNLVSETRDLISEFDWNCIISTRFPTDNLGCGQGVSTAITWAFDTEESLIILEDDIAPELSFFKYCDELLERYDNDENVFAVSGCNFVPSTLLRHTESYRYSSIPHVWGWATWRKSWETYSFDISDWRKDLPIRELRKSLGGSILATFMWARIFNLVAAKKIDTWDYQLCYAVLKSRSKVATSNVNAVTNIGFSEYATHTAIAPRYLLDAQEVKFPLSHPENKLNSEVDKWTQRNVMGASFLGLVKAALNSLKK